MSCAFLICSIASSAFGLGRAPDAGAGSSELQGRIADLQRQTKQQQESLVKLQSDLDQERNERRSVQASVDEKLVNAKESTRRELFTWLVFTVGIVLTTTGWLGIKIVQQRVLTKVRRIVRRETAADASRHRELAKVLIFCRLGYLYWQSARDKKDRDSKVIDTLFAYRAMISALQAVDSLPKKKSPGERKNCLEAESQFLFHRLMLHNLGASPLQGDERHEIRSRAHALFRTARDDRSLASYVSDVRNWTETYALILRDLDGDAPGATEVMRPIIGAIVAGPPSQSRDEELAYYRDEWPDVTRALEQSNAATIPKTAERRRWWRRGNR